MWKGFPMMATGPPTPGDLWGGIGEVWGVLDLGTPNVYHRRPPTLPVLYFESGLGHLSK